MNSFSEISFHEANLDTIAAENATLTLELSDVYTKQGKRSASVILTEIGLIIRDGVEVNSISMEAPDGEILTLQENPKGLHMIVEWSDFKTHKRYTCSYRFESGSVQVKVK